MATIIHITCGGHNYECLDSGIGCTWLGVYNGTGHFDSEGFAGDAESYGNFILEPDEFDVAGIARGMAEIDTSVLVGKRIISAWLDGFGYTSTRGIGGVDAGRATLVITDASSATDYNSLKNCAEITRLTIPLDESFVIPIDIAYINTAGLTKLGIRVATEYAGTAPMGDGGYGDFYGNEKVSHVDGLYIEYDEVTTIDATQITSSSAVLNGSQTGMTTVFFEYGRTSDNLSQSTSQMSATDTFYRRVDGLLSLQDYYFRAVGVIDGEYVYGETLGFITLSPTTPAKTPTAGCQWIEGTDYHYIDSSGVERKATGILV